MRGMNLLVTSKRNNNILVLNSEKIGVFAASGHQ